jgi:hypothetical protein
VVLSEQLLNKINTLREMAEMAEALPSVPLPVIEPVPKRQHQHRMTDAERLEVAAGYRAGATMKELGDRYGVHESTVCTTLQRLGVPSRKPSGRPRTGTR